MQIDHDLVLHGPARLSHRGENGVRVLLDPEAPRWVATDERGAGILGRFDGGAAVGAVARDYGRDVGLEWAKAWQHVDTVVRDALRAGFLTAEAPVANPHGGRVAHVGDARLTELWIHTNNSCNLACEHCLVSSGPDGDPGLPTDALLDVIAQARALGVRRWYFTGGEPFVRKDIDTLIEAVLDDPDAELAVLTNGILLKGARLEALRKFDRERLRLQISLDGSTPAINDPIRGVGSFTRIVEGIHNAIGVGLNVAVTTAVTRSNLDDVTNVTRLVADLGGKNHHLLWLHKRGRAGTESYDDSPPIEDVIAVVRRARETAAELGVVIDNCEAVKERLNVPAAVRRDLSNACVESLCVYSDGNVYPSAAMANVPELRLGTILGNPLELVWRDSDVARSFRETSVEQKEICRDCDLKYLCGGGDLEHAYFWGGSLLAHDPYCKLHLAMASDAFDEIVDGRRAHLTNGRSGFDAPILFHAMGEGSVTCATDEEYPEVIVGHSECVRSFELDRPRELVRAFYGDAAETPQEELCCPVRPRPEDLAHIPEDVVARFYGCGSPVDLADVQPGETTLDLGSGAGIDVFIAAKYVGAEGQAIGVDMTDRMLAVANENRPIVATNLGYDSAEFRKGFLEEIPVETGTVDLVTSNCVINLSPDKQRVFSEIWRVLNDHGRVVVSDIISAQEVPAHQRRDPRLWGECISGALTEEEFLTYLERAGFYGVQVLRKTFWREVEGYDFYSVTVRGYRFEKKDGCAFRGQHAIYRGPMKGVSDEEGHWFPRGVPIEVCTDTAAKLGRDPYRGAFLVLEPDEKAEAAALLRDDVCDPTAGCC